MQTPVLVMAALSVSIAAAQVQVANAVSSAPFTLREASVAAGQGVPNWPVLVGDTVKAGTAKTTLTFVDGSVITLNPGASGRVNMSGGVPSFELLSGTGEYALKTPTSVRLMSSPGGAVPAGLKPVTTGAWTTGRLVMVIGGAGAAVGTTVGFAVANSGGSSVSGK
jgi:hypothetical protein